MAASTIKGITIEIGGDTTKLDKALSGVNKQSRDLQKELKEVEKGLKLDPKNTELLAQKQTLLKEAVAATSEKLDVLKSAEAQVQKQFENGEVSEEQYRALQREIIKTEADLKNLKTAAEDSNSTLEKAGEIAGKIGEKSEALGRFHISGKHHQTKKHCNNGTNGTGLSGKQGSTLQMLQTEVNRPFHLHGRQRNPRDRLQSGRDRH